MMSWLFHVRAVMLILALVALISADSVVGRGSGEIDASSVLLLVLGLAGLVIAVDLRRRSVRTGPKEGAAWDAATQTAAAMVMADLLAAEGGRAEPTAGAVLRLGITPLLDADSPLDPGETDRLLHVVMERARRTLRTDDVVTRVGVLDVAVTLHGLGPQARRVVDGRATPRHPPRTRGPRPARCATGPTDRCRRRADQR